MHEANISVGGNDDGDVEKERSRKDIFYCHARTLGSFLKTIDFVRNTTSRQRISKLPWQTYVNRIHHGLVFITLLSARNIIMCLFFYVSSFIVLSNQHFYLRDCFLEPLRRIGE